MTDYRLYVDDSGTKEYALRGEEYGRGGGKSRYFVFGGLVMAETKAGPFADAIAEEKRRVFGTAEVEIKSNWLRFPKERERRYLTAFAINEDTLRDFVGRYCRKVPASETPARISSTGRLSRRPPRRHTSRARLR